MITKTNLRLTFVAAIVSVIIIIHPAAALKMPALAGLSTSLDMWGMQIDRLIEGGQLKVDEFEKIDFSAPYQQKSATTASTSVRYQFFNPRSMFGSIGRLSHEDIDRFTIVKGVEPIFNIRRVVSSEKIVDTLVIIIPNFDPDACMETPAESPPDQTLKIGKDNKEIIVDTAPISKCIRTQDKHVYYVFPLVRRTKLADSNEWLGK